MDYTDQQLTNTVPNTNPVLTFVDNLGKSRIVGAELEVSFRPTQGVDLSAFVSYNDADFLEWENNIGTVGGVNYGVVDLSHRPVGYYS
jgi:outer membrane receptor protein involved in Fe transport